MTREYILLFITIDKYFRNHRRLFAHLAANSLNMLHTLDARKSKSDFYDVVLMLLVRPFLSSLTILYCIIATVINMQLSKCHLLVFRCPTTSKSLRAIKYNIALYLFIYLLQVRMFHFNNFIIVCVLIYYLSIRLFMRLDIRLLFPLLSENYYQILVH
jgi:hypothetical protein